jgi:hypothetical protein
MATSSGTGGGAHCRRGGAIGGSLELQSRALQGTAAQDFYPMQVVARAVVKAVRGSGFFFPKLDGMAWLLPSSSDGMDVMYGCGTTSSPSSLASIIPKGSERLHTKTARVWRVLANCGLKLKQIWSIFIGLLVLSRRGDGDKLDSISKSNQMRKGKD